MDIVAETVQEEEGKHVLIAEEKDISVDSVQIIFQSTSFVGRAKKMVTLETNAQMFRVRVVGRRDI